MQNVGVPLWILTQGVVDSLTAAASRAAAPQQQPAAVQAAQLRATLATTNPGLQATNLLHELDGAAQEVIAAIAAAQVPIPDLHACMHACDRACAASHRGLPSGRLVRSACVLHCTP